MEWNDNKPEGSLKYSPHIKEEKIIETTTNSFFQLCRTGFGREIAEQIINNYINNGNQSRQTNKPGRSYPKEVSNKVPKVREVTDGDL
jgi:hypothetical protein